VRVLIVDDDDRLAGSLCRSLGEEGMAVDMAVEGEAGLMAALNTDYDVIVLDVMLPGTDGVEVSRRLRASSVPTPVLMLTARDSVPDRVLGLEAGADDYLVKPFAITELVARIRALARRHLPHRSAELRAGRIVLDTAARILTVGDRVVDLTPKEFAILEYFLLNRGKLLTRTQVLDHAWNFEFDGGGRNLIDIYVGRLRRKLVAAGATDPFVTVRGAGYRFSADDV
jgi:two-component system OmpR family response regulator